MTLCCCLAFWLAQRFGAAARLVLHVRVAAELCVWVVSRQSPNSFRTMWRIRPARHLWQTNCPPEGMLPKTSRFSSQFRLYLISLGLVLFRSPYSLNTSLPCDSLHKGARSLAGRDRVACELACASVLLSSRASREVQKFEKCKNVALLCSFPWDFASETIHRACIHVIGRFIRASHFAVYNIPSHSSTASPQLQGRDCRDPISGPKP